MNMIMNKELVDNVQWTENNMHMIAMTTESHFWATSYFSQFTINITEIHIPYFIS